jgi:hypothetical protein
MKQKDMKTDFLKLFCCLACLGATVSASAAGIPSLTITLQDAGNSQTEFSFSANFFAINTGIWVSSTTITGISGLEPTFSGCINDLGGYTDPVKANAFGTFNNPNGSTEGGTSSAQLVGLQFVAQGGSAYSVALNWDDTLGIGPGDRVTYTPSTDSTTIDVPFSIFNPGTYSYTEMAGTGAFGQNVNYTLTVVGAVPEPSTLVLAVMGGLLLFRRRLA